MAISVCRRRTPGGIGGRRWDFVGIVNEECSEGSEILAHQMKTDESNDNKTEHGIQVRIRDSIVGILPNNDGDLCVTGTQPIMRGQLQLFLHEKLLSRGRTRGDALRVAIMIAKDFDGEVLGLEKERSRIREGWVRLLKSHLMPEAAQTYGRGMTVFRPCRGLRVTFAAVHRRLLSCNGASVLIGDPKSLIIHPDGKNRWRAKWEDLIGVSFQYSDDILDVQAMWNQTGIIVEAPWFDRKVADLRAELEKLPAARQEQLRRELKGDAEE
jgi:hypothetical protein